MKKQIKQLIRRFQARKKTANDYGQAALGVGLFAVSLAILALSGRQQSIPDYQTGAIYRGDKIYAPATFRYRDTAATAEKRRRIEGRFPYVYVRNYKTASECREKLTTFIEQVTQVSNQRDLEERRRVYRVTALFRRIFDRSITYTQGSRLLSLLRQRREADRYIINLWRHVMEEVGFTDLSMTKLRRDFERSYRGRHGVFIYSQDGEPERDSFLTDYRSVFTKRNFFSNLKKVYPSIIPADLKQEYRDIIFQVVRAAAKPNLYYEPTFSEINRKELMQKFEPVIRTVKTGEKIIESGERITQRHLDIFETMRQIKSKTGVASVLGYALLLAAVWLLLLYFAKHYITEYRILSKQSLILALFLLALLLLTMLTHRLSAAVSQNSDTFFAITFLPLAFFIMTTAVLINERMAFVLNAMVAILIYIISGKEFSSMIIAFLSGTAAVFAMETIKTRADIFKASLFVCLGNIGALLVTVLLLGKGWMFLLKSSMIFGINGLVCTMLTVGALPFFEWFLKITTIFRLMELSDVNQPILKRMLVEASGTYNHSMLVATMAENAAERIGNSNPLLARVGAYYHDIGKIERPEYFIENQTAINLHDKLKPSISVSIIKKHVKRSIEIAREIGLPAEVIDIIAQHHGRSLVRFFYSKEQLNRQDLPPEERASIENHYRYNHEPPQTVEAAVVMLADSCEAAVRAMSKPTYKKIETHIKKIVDQKMADGDLRYTPLTFRDLTEIGEVYLSVLSGVYHTRVEYPEHDRD